MSAAAAATTQPESAAGERPGSGMASTVALATLLLGPIIAVNGLAFLMPVFNLLLLSFRESLGGSTIGEAYTLANWSSTLFDSYYIELIVQSILTSLMITALTLVASYPIALYLHRSKGRWRTFLLVLVISPLLTSAVVRTYGWIAILADDGLINNMLKAFGVEAMRLIFNKVGVVIGLTEILMPYMILALLAGFGRLDPRVEEAAETLGASPWKVFWRIVVPLTMPGVALGCLLSFVLAVSSFITPKLLGGGRVFLLATEIYDQAIVTLNWPLAATLSMIVLVIFGAALVLYSRLLRAVI
ncbi:polyamine ABC transporter permease [Rhizobium rhizosphaerae]|uniref:Polyamine ABC transporter permease n=2 Tax=Xaviernesmea rhizosphaerae TaxID=1672749 RepID=A0ABX3PD57_9HYPH|nr:ABC transporter permease [Xaviernesmea rhizosphaerae]OQP86396.1 polyamine ABC transporter permease [Xaviernesmea rhizosphaerae]